MKAVLLFFVLLNVLFYGWSQWVAPPPGGRLTATVEPDAEQLVLFREAYPDIERPAELDVSALALPEDVVEEGDSDAEPADSVAKPAGGESAGTATPGSDSADAAATPSAVQEAGEDGAAADRSAPGPGAAESASPAAAGTRTASEAVASDAQRAVDSSAASDAAAAARAAEPDIPAALTTDDASASTARGTPAVVVGPVTEAPAVLRPAAASATTASADATPIPPGVAAGEDAAADAVDIARAAVDPEVRCVELGPFARLRQATEAAARLREQGLTPSQRLEESEIWAGHWVHLVPYPTRAEAIAVVEMLREGGINDLYIEPSGDMRNAVSLGLFSDVEGAEIRAGRVRRLGVKPQIRDRRRTGTVYWLDLALPPEVQLEPASFAPTPQQPIELNERECAAGG